MSTTDNTPTAETQAHADELVANQAAFNPRGGKAPAKRNGPAKRTPAKRAQSAKAKAAETSAAMAEDADTDPTRGPATPAPAELERVTFKDAAEQVLRAGDGPMKVKAIAELAIPLVRPVPQGKTPAATLGAHLVVDANKGGRFVKTAPGTFDVRELNPAGANTRPAAAPAKASSPRKARKAPASSSTPAPAAA